jgi:hypothetical protein
MDVLGALTAVAIGLVCSTVTAHPVTFESPWSCFGTGLSWMFVGETRRDRSRREALIRPEEPIGATSSFLEADRILLFLGGKQSQPSW